MAANSRFAVATHILLSIAHHSSQSENEEGALVTSDYLASSVNTSPVLIRRITGQLKKAGLVKATKGCSGGACLARHADKITLFDIYMAVDEGSLFAQNPNTPNKNCPISLQVGKILEPVFLSSEKMLEMHLKKTKLSDLVHKIR